MSEDPTLFHFWWKESEMTDRQISEATFALSADHGISIQTVRRVRYGKPCSPFGIRLLMEVTGLPFGAFLPQEFLRGLGRRR